ncbi:MAG: helix-turn-helix transcriptional regulator [Clostridia bacterium]|nr:helix-turn-helix transcriptional regulator [Clostridia bacterium]
MNRIKQLRDELKMSQNDLGKKLNKTQQQISLYENGTNELDLDGYIILSKLFSCSIEYIAGKSDLRSPAFSDYASISSVLAKEAEGLSSIEVSEVLKFYKNLKNMIIKNNQ